MSVTAAKSVEVRMDFAARKVNSVRFEAPRPDEGQPKPAMTTAYIANEAYAALGEPESIVVTVTAG